MSTHLQLMHWTFISWISSDQNCLCCLNTNKLLNWFLIFSWFPFRDGLKFSSLLFVCLTVVFHFTLLFLSLTLTIISSEPFIVYLWQSASSIFWLYCFKFFLFYFYYNNFTSFLILTTIVFIFMWIPLILTDTISLITINIPNNISIVTNIYHFFLLIL